jgi:hypothetical protein
MRQRIVKLIILFFSMTLSGLFALEIISSSATNIGGSVTASGGQLPSTFVTINVNEIGLFRDVVEGSPGTPVATRTNLSPQESLVFRFNVTDTGAFNYGDLKSVTVKMFYSENLEHTRESVFGDTEYGSGVTNATDGSGLNFVWRWEYTGTNSSSGTVTQGIVFEDGLDSTISSWSRDFSELRAPTQAFMDTSGADLIDFDFAVPIQVSKIAKLAENRNWHIAVLVEKDQNAYDKTSFAVLGQFGVTWYGEISITSPNAFVWPLNSDGGTDLNPQNHVLFGSTFTDATNKTNFQVRYISNGNYQHTIQSSGTWISNVGNPLNNGQPYTATLVNGNPTHPQEMAIRFSSSGISTFNEDLPNLTSDLQVMNEKNSFTSSPEIGDLYDYHLWVQLADEFQNGTYRGTVTLGMRDPFYVILNLDDHQYYAGTTFAQLTNSFQHVNAQEALNAAVTDATDPQLTIQTIKLLREINANLMIVVGGDNTATNEINYGLNVDFDKHRLIGNVSITGQGVAASTVTLSGLGIISGTLEIDGFNLSVISDAEVLGTTLIKNTSLSSYNITERHHGVITVGSDNVGRARIVSSNNAVDARVNINTIERVFLEGGFDRVTLQNASGRQNQFQWISHVRLDNATVEEIFATVDAEVYVASGSTVTSGLHVSTGKNMKLFVEQFASVNEVFVGSGAGTFDYIRFTNLVHNQTRNLSYSTIQAAIDAANVDDVIYVTEGTFSQDVNVNKRLHLLGLQYDFRGIERNSSSRNRGESTLTGNISVTNDDAVLNGFKYVSSNDNKITVTRNDVTFKSMLMTSTSSSTTSQLVVLSDVSGFEINQSAAVDSHTGITIIAFSGTVSNLNINNNVFHSINGDAIGSTSNRVSLTDFVIQDNRFVLSGSSTNEILLDFPIIDSGLIVGNLFTSNRATAIRVESKEDGTNVTNLSIINNQLTFKGATNSRNALNNFVFVANSHTATFSGIQINDNDFGTGSVDEGIQDYAIKFQSQLNRMMIENIEVKRNTVEQRGTNLLYGLILVASSNNPETTTTWTNITIENNTLPSKNFGSTGAIAFNMLGGVTLRDVLIKDNNITDDFNGFGITISSTGLDTLSDTIENVTLLNNNIRVFGTNKNAIEIYSENNSIISGLKIESNTLRSHNAAGLLLHGSGNSTWDNIVIGSGTFPQHINNSFGIQLRFNSGLTTVNQLQIINNTLTETVGIDVVDFNLQPSLTLTGNNFNHNDQSNNSAWFVRDLNSNQLDFFAIRAANTFSNFVARMAFADAGFIQGIRPDNSNASNANLIFPIVTEGSGFGFSATQLQLAIDKANENDTLFIRSQNNFFTQIGSPAVPSSYGTPQTFTLTQPIIINTSGLTIKSNIAPVTSTNRTQAILALNGTDSSIFDVRASGVTIQDLTFRRQNATGSGSSVLVQADHVTLSGLRFISTGQGGIPVFITNQNVASVSGILIQNIEINSGVIVGTSSSANFIGGSSYTPAVPSISRGTFSSGVVIETTQAGSISFVRIENSTLIGSGVSEGILLLTQTGVIENTSIEGNTVRDYTRGIVLPLTHQTTVTSGNTFVSNSTHWLDAQSSPDARRTVLDNNTFDRLAADEAFVSSGLIVGNTITSAPQIFINIDRLEAYATLQEAVDGASEGDTINIASSGVYSDAQLNGANNGTVTVTVSGLTITSVVPDNFAVLRNTSASDAPVLDLQASGITVESIQVVRENATITSSGQGVIQLNAPFITLSGILFDGITSNELAAIGLVNTVEELSGLVISTNTFSGVFATMIEVVNQADTGQIGLLIDNNVTGSGIFTTKDGSTTSGIVRLIAFEDKLVRLNAFDTVVVTNNLFGSDAVNSTLIPIIDTALIDSLTSLVTTIPADAGLYTVNSWALVETASGLSTTTNEENQTKFDQLTSALGGLVLQASFDALEAEVNFSSGLLVADFTTATFDPFNTQLTNSIDLLPLDGDPQYNTDYFDNTRTILIHTMIALEFISQEALSGLVNVTTSGLDVSNFVSPALFTTTRNSGLLLLDQISTSGVKAVFEGAPVLSNTVVSGLSNNLQTELSGLVFLNYDAFLTELNLVSGLVESNFEAAEWPAFETALTSGLLINNNVTSSGALATFDDVSLTSGTILSITTSIQTARGNLVFSGLEVLSGLINTTTSGLTQNNFADDVWNPFFEARSSGLLIVNAVASAGALATFEDAPLSSGAISFITTTLTTRFELLGLSFNGLDTLSGLVNLTTSGLDLTNFTEETRDPFSEARTSGIDLLDAILTSGAIARFDDQLVSETLITSISDDLLDRFNGLVYEGFVELSGLVSGDTSGLIESNFIESTWTPFNNARTSGLEVLAAIVSSGAVTRFEDVTLTSGTINEIRGTLQNAFDALDFKGYIELSGLVQLVTPLDASNFTDPASFEAARTSGILITTEVEASGAIAIFDGIRLSSGVIEVVFNALNDATSGLSLLGLDTLSGLVNTTTSGLDASNFISSTFAPFNEARTSGILVLDAITLSGVFTIYEGTLVTSGLIEQTINELNQSSGAVEFESFASLEAIVNQSSGLSADNFEPTEFAVFDEALQSGLSIQSAITASGILAEFENVRLTSGVIKFVDDAIRAAIPTLEFTGLATLSGLLETTSGLDETNFTLDTWTAFDAAFGSGTIIVGAASDLGAFAIYEDAPLSATAILDVTNQINTTYAALIYSGASELETVVNTANGLNSGLYDTTYDSFFIALTSGQSILTNIASDTPRAMLGDDLITSGLIAEIQQAILTSSK